MRSVKSTFAVAVLVTLAAANAQNHEVNVDLGKRTPKAQAVG
jgi:hypothetical protein